MTVLSLALVLAPIPEAATTPETDPADLPTSRIAARVLAHTGAPVAGASIVAYHLSTEEVFRSPPTDSKGRAEITGLSYGYFDLAIEAPDGLFVANQVVNVTPAGKVALTFTLIAEDGERPFAGSDLGSAGLAQMLQKDGSFLTSGKGIAVLGAAASLLLLGAAGGGGSDDSPGTSSPSQ